MNALSKLAAATGITLSFAATAVAQEFAHSAMAAHAGHAANAAHQTALAEGEIKKIDKETGKVTIRQAN